MCTLEHAFTADSLYALIFRIINGTYQPLDAARFSVDLIRLQESLLEKDPAQRPSCRMLLGSPFIQMHISKTMNKVRMDDFWLLLSLVYANLGFPASLP